MNAQKTKDTYKASRIFYYFEVALEYIISVITSGAYLAKLTTTIGISDATTAVLSTIGSLAGAFQIFSIFLSRKRPVKKWIIPFRLVEQLLRAGLFLLPFLSIGTGALSAIFFALTLVYQILYHASTPAKTVWFMNLVDENARGKFVSISQVVSLGLGMVATFAFSAMLDKFESANNLTGAFTLIAIVLLATSVLHALLLLFSKEKPTEEEKVKNPLSSIGALFKNKDYVKYLILNVVWAIAANLSMPFLGTYQINELGFTMTIISIIEIVFSLVNMLFVFICGRLSSKIPSLFFLRFGYALYAIHFFVLAFMVPENGLFMFFFGHFFYLLGLSAVTVGNTMIYNLVDESEHTAAVAFITIASGVVGFFTALSITPLFNYIQKDLSSQLFGMTIYAQQVLNVLSGIVAILINIYLLTAIKKPKSISSEEKTTELDGQ